MKTLPKILVIGDQYEKFYEFQNGLKGQAKVTFISDKKVRVGRSKSILVDDLKFIYDHPLEPYDAIVVLVNDQIQMHYIVSVLYARLGSQAGIVVAYYEDPYLKTMIDLCNLNLIRLPKPCVDTLIETCSNVLNEIKTNP